MSKQYFIVQTVRPGDININTLTVFEDHEVKNMLDFVKTKISNPCSLDKQKMSMIIDGRYSEAFIYSDYSFPRCSFGIDNGAIVYIGVHGTKE